MQRLPVFRRLRGEGHSQDPSLLVASHPPLAVLVLRPVEEALPLRPRAVLARPVHPSHERHELLGEIERHLTPPAVAQRSRQRRPGDHLVDRRPRQLGLHRVVELRRLPLEVFFGPGDVFVEPARDRRAPLLELARDRFEVLQVARRHVALQQHDALLSAWWDGCSPADHDLLLLRGKHTPVTSTMSSYRIACAQCASERWRASYLPDLGRGGAQFPTPPKEHATRPLRYAVASVG